MLGDFYLKDVWRFAAVGQGFDGGLDALLKNFGGEVAEEEPAAQPIRRPPLASPRPRRRRAGARLRRPAAPPAPPAPAAPQPPPVLRRPRPRPPPAPAQVPPRRRPSARPIASAQTVTAADRRPPARRTASRRQQPRTASRPAQPRSARPSPAQPPAQPSSRTASRRPRPRSGQQAPQAAAGAFRCPQGVPQGPGRRYAASRSSKYREAPTGQRWTPQNEQLIRVDLGIDGQPVLARQGSMVLYQGKVDFSYKGAGFARPRRRQRHRPGDAADALHRPGPGLPRRGRRRICTPSSCRATASASPPRTSSPSTRPCSTRSAGSRATASPAARCSRCSSRAPARSSSRRTASPVVLPVTPTTFADCNAVVAWSAASQVIVSSQVRLRRNAYPGTQRRDREPPVPGRARQLHRRPAVRGLREPVMNQQLAGFAPAPSPPVWRTTAPHAQGRHADRPGPLRAHRLDGRLRGLRPVRAQPAGRAPDRLAVDDRRGRAR